MADGDAIKEKPTVDYTGLKIGLALSPVLLLFVYLGKADMGLTVGIVLVAIVFAVKVHWNLRKHVWFWTTIVFMLVLHVPLFLFVRWPHGNVPGIFYGMPFAIADYVIISKGLSLAERILSKNAPRNDQT